MPNTVSTNPPQRTRRCAAACLVAVVAVGLAGCGASQDAIRSTTTTVTVTAEALTEVAAGSLGTPVVVPPGDERSVVDRVRILTLNMHHGEGSSHVIDLEAVADLIMSVSPDIVSLQEVERMTERSMGVDQAAVLADLTGMDSVFGWNVDFRGGGFGNAVLSRHPIVNSRNQILPHPFGFEPRGVLEVEILLPSGETITVLATHLDHNTEPDVRLRSVDAINDLVDGLVRPVVLAGDLNAEPRSETIAALAESWLIGPVGVPTYPALGSFKRIDHVLATPKERWIVKDTVAVGDASVSDHRALLVLLDLLD